MTDKLQLAINAARSGNKKEAQQILANMLQEDASATQAWFLLSQLVESPQKQAAYLGKVLALDPTHPLAQEKMAQLQGETAVSPTPSPPDQTDRQTGAKDDTDDLLGQVDATTLPDWLADEAEDIGAEETAAPDVPDWVNEKVDTDWVNPPPAAADTVIETPALPESKPQPATETKPAKPAAKAVATPAPKKSVSRDQDQSLTRMLYVLITLAVIVFSLLLFVILT